MNYYAERQAVINEIERILIKKGKGGAVKFSMIYILLKEYQVSEKFIEAQIEKLKILDMVKEKDGILFWKGGEVKC